VVPDGAHPIVSAPGGLLGAGVFDLMVVPFGGFGAFLFAVALTCTGFAFATKPAQRWGAGGLDQCGRFGYR